MPQSEQQAAAAARAARRVGGPQCLGGDFGRLDEFPHAQLKPAQAGQRRKQAAHLAGGRQGQHSDPEPHDENYGLS